MSSVASRFLSAIQDGENMSKSETEAMRNVLANAYLGNVFVFALRTTLAHQDVFTAGSETVGNRPFFSEEFVL